jgi:hypothetical protein
MGAGQVGVGWGSIKILLFRTLAGNKLMFQLIFGIKKIRYALKIDRERE